VKPTEAEGSHRNVGTVEVGGHADRTLEVASDITEELFQRLLPRLIEAHASEMERRTKFLQPEAAATAIQESKLTSPTADVPLAPAVQSSTSNVLADSEAMADRIALALAAPLAEALAQKYHAPTAADIAQAAVGLFPRAQDVARCTVALLHASPRPLHTPTDNLNSVISTGSLTDPPSPHLQTDARRTTKSKIPRDCLPCSQHTRF